MSEIGKPEQANGSELVMNMVIKSLRGIYPSFEGIIKTQAKLDNMKFEWLQAFIDHGIKTDSQINRGLKKCRIDSSSFLPSVGQFILWCKEIDRSHLEVDTKALGHETTKLSPAEVKELLAKNKKRLGL